MLLFLLLLWVAVVAKIGCTSRRSSLALVLVDTVPHFASPCLTSAPFLLHFKYRLTAADTVDSVMHGTPLQITSDRLRFRSCDISRGPVVPTLLASRLLQALLLQYCSPSTEVALVATSYTIEQIFERAFDFLLDKVVALLHQAAPLRPTTSSLQHRNADSRCF